MANSDQQVQHKILWACAKKMSPAKPGFGLCICPQLFAGHLEMDAHAVQFCSWLLDLGLFGVLGKVFLIQNKAVI